MSSSLESIVSLQRAEAIALLTSLTKEEANELLFKWRFWARAEQLGPPGNWRTWLILAGRGWGKTRTGAEWVRQRAEAFRGHRIHLIGATAADVRDTMVEGPAGILACSPDNARPHYEPSKRRLTWPNRRDVGGSDIQGAMATTFSADEPDRLRGPQCGSLWGDELACFVAGTMIETSRGLRPIESIVAGDEVLTREGFRRVARSERTGIDARTFRLITIKGRTLVGTANHPIFLEGKGFTPLSAVQRGDILLVCTKSNGTDAFGIETPTFAVHDVVQSVEEMDSLHDVYNIGVEGVHEYFANGILVHNCWQYPEAWDQSQMGLRLGDDPRAIVTTTPRPTPIIRSLVKDSTTFVTRGSTYDNKSNLAATFIDRMKKKYEGTRLGRQELFAEILDDAPGALWKREQLDTHRVSVLPSELKQIIIGVDPAVADLTNRKDLDREKLAETGIVTVGLGPNNHGYVIRDDSGHYTPNEWAQKVIKVFDITQANYIVAEGNNGGALVKSNLQTVRPSLPVQLVHASRGKLTRAEPVGAVYEQNRVHHLGCLPILEDQMCTWEPELGMKSPDRLDALVWALTFLMVDGNMDLVTKKPDLVEAVMLDNISVFG